MATLEHLRSAVIQVLEELYHYNTYRQEKDIFSEMILDKERDHYLLLDVGWKGKQYIYDPFIHIDIKDGKIWLQRNFTDVDLGEKLTAMGVKKEDIILGLHSPFMRQFSDYGAVTVE